MSQVARSEDCTAYHSRSAESQGRRHESTAPLVSVGLPVHNGMPYIAEALDALCAQTYCELEIVVRDNGSNDDTTDVCRAAAARDSRIRIISVDCNEGAAQNFNQVFAATTGQFFSWAAHDDHCMPPYIERCVTALLADSTIALCVPSVAFIDEEGRRTGVLIENPDLSSARLAIRLRCFLHRDGWYMLYGVARREAFAEGGLFGSSWGPDVVLLWRILLCGPVGVLPDVLFEYRRYRAKSFAGVWEGLLPDGARERPSFLHLQMVQVMWQDTATLLLGRERRVARLALLRWFTTVYFRDLLFADLNTAYLRARDRRQWWAAVVPLGAMALIRPSRAIHRTRRSRIGAAPDVSDPSSPSPDRARAS